MKKILLDYNLQQLEEMLAALNVPKFRALQLFQALHSGKALTQISTLPKTLIETLQIDYVNETIIEIKKQESEDGTVKFLFMLQDNNAIESVLMKYKYGYSVCVSTQVGCRMRCEFCASGIRGLTRNLSAGEMLAQVTYINAYLGGKLGEERKVTNVVLMGTGEPLDNYDNVLKFLKLLNDKNGLNISYRNLSLSTCGIVPKIKELADEQLPIVLTISLHSATDIARKSIMPIAKKFDIKELLDACKYYYKKIGRRVVFEYILIKNVTVTNENKKSLIQLFKNAPFHLNLIMLNEVEGKLLQKVSSDDSQEFLNDLKNAGLSVTLRRTLGDDIDAACGQLREKHIKDKKE
ncbi:MAG: 23S rRNA (adenine(2503)-C(2))-methyltransferase RlmN [Tenericutes bacterium HGW-Tenericutes-4]|nr:MAG: 23S rRNA (adenine(2503)-C(2))-methyltransferase RlmN [Tenericutes bacterium HGW-Tenericutes-4]